MSIYDRKGSPIITEFFQVAENSVEWDEWGRYAGVAIAARDERGLLGPLSEEFRLGQ